MTKEQLIASVREFDKMKPADAQAKAGKWAPHLAMAMACFDITKPARQAAFIAQIGHESGGLTVLEENLRYDAKGLLRVFPKYFDAESAKAYEKKPEMIASRTYANRMGNGDEASRDGWLFRGRGLIQLTGRESYGKCGRDLGLDLVNKPELLLEAQPASMSAGWEWSIKGCNPHADAGNFEKVCKLINGGLNGYPDRLERWARAKAVFKVS